MNAIRALFLAAFMAGIRNQWRDVKKPLKLYWNGNRHVYGFPPL